MIDTETDNKNTFYGRRKARPLRIARQSSLDTILPQIEIKDIKSALTFPFEPREVWLEIGFGNGDSLASWHREHPDIAFIGCEPFINGVSFLTKMIAEDDLSNIKILPDTAQPLLNELPGACLDRIYLLNSDPWPKKRHHRRRVIQPDTIKSMARLLKDGGHLTMTTDHQGLADWMLEHALNEPDLEWTAQNANDWQTPPDGWMPTKYEKKGGKEGRKQTYLIFKKK